MIIKFSFPVDITMNSKKQVFTQYKSGLPDYLLTFVDSIIKSDRSQILRYNFLHYTIDELLRQDVPRQDSICLFFDPEGVNHIFFENIKNYSNHFSFRTAQSFIMNEWKTMSPQDEPNIKYLANPLFLKYFTNTELQNWSDLKVVSIDQIRCKCQANVYMDPEEVIKQILKLISWNQIFRTKSANSFIYITILLENITSIINKKKFHKRFLHFKKKDFEKLLNYELRYKFNVSSWPYVPEKFREYQQINGYVPTPQKRSQFIEKRLVTKKSPVECPENCVCYSQLPEGQQFCKYTLKDGWVTQCPNRVNKIQCNHTDPQKMSKCRNAEIKKCQRKKCRKNDQEQDEDVDIQQCVMWGIDYYTRNIIYNCLPEVDYDLNQCSQNKQSKNIFIEETLLKAINFNGYEGYNLQNACNYIMRYKQKSQKSIKQCQNLTNHNSTQKSIQKQFQKQKLQTVCWSFLNIKQSQEVSDKENQLFTSKDALYANILLQKYRFCNQNIDNTAFRIHTKGKGARCIRKQGIKQGNFIVEYYGELYQPWRWYEREDFIKQIMKKKKLKNYIPEFYNIYLEHHKDDPEGYDLMVVDPNKKGNFSSRFSHSCTPNCGTVTTISNGKYYIGMYSFRDIKYGEELTFDYCCMTQSSYQHTHSICLCGTQKCRGNYLDLANSRSQLVDKNTCFLSRNSLILQALEPVTPEDYALCAQFNIKERMLSDSPDWIIKWAAKLVKFIEQELKMHKNEQKQKWTNNYPWEVTSPEVKQANIELYSETSKNDLFALRFQNLFTTLDKLKYFLNANNNQSKDSPLIYIEQNQLVQIFIGTKQGKDKKETILAQIQQAMVENVRKNQLFLIKKFREIIALTDEQHIKLFYFRLCCLCVSHMCYSIKPTPRFNSYLLADIIYFYAFTHTFFTAKQYKAQVSEELKVSLMEITGKPIDEKTTEKQKRRYNTQFVWGQLVSWYKQTIVSPEASLSQDRRGTLSYPMIKSTLNSSYPFEKHNRNGFLKALRDKSSNSWPCAPNHGCLLSFKNPFKCYGTVFFENVHNDHLFKDFSNGNLLDNVLDKINSTFNEKLELFKKVQNVLSKIGDLHEAYAILDHIQAKYFSFTQSPPLEFPPIQEQKPKKKKKGNKQQ